MLFGNGSLGAGDGRKSRPTVPTMGAERGIPEARCQPGPDFILTQIVSHRRHQLVENVGVNLVERVVIQCGKIIAVRKFRGTFSISSRTVEKFYDCPECGGRRNGSDPQKCRRQPRSDRFAHRVNVPGDPFVSFLAVNPKGYASAFLHSRGQTRKTRRGVRQMVQDADGKWQVEHGADRRGPRKDEKSRGALALPGKRLRNGRGRPQIFANTDLCRNLTHHGAMSPPPPPPPQ